MLFRSPRLLPAAGPSWVNRVRSSCQGFSSLAGLLYVLGWLVLRGLLLYPFRQKLLGDQPPVAYLERWKTLCVDQVIHRRPGNAQHLRRLSYAICKLCHLFHLLSRRPQRAAFFMRCPCLAPPPMLYFSWQRCRAAEIYKNVGGIQ